MKKTLAGAMDILVLICMLLISAVITVSSVSLIVGDTASIRRDKALVEIGDAYRDLNVKYKCSDFLAALTCFDFMCPVDRVDVYAGDKMVSFYPSTTLSQINRLTYSRRVKAAIEEAYKNDPNGVLDEFTVNDMLNLDANLTYFYDGESYVCSVIFKKGEVELKWET